MKKPKIQTRKYVIFGSSWVVFPSNRALYITFIGWVNSLTLGVVLIFLSLSPPTCWASKPYRAFVDASYVAEMSQFVYRVYAAFIQSPYAVMLLFEGSWSLTWSFLSYLDFACQPFPVQLLVHAPYDRVLPHYIALLSTLCWMMGDALMSSF